MKFLVRNQQQTDGDNPKRALLGTQTSFDIPNGAITWLSIIYLFVNIVATSLSSYLSNKPQRDIDWKNAELKEQNFKVQLLQRVLEIDNADERKASIKLLIASGLIEDEKDNLTKFMGDPTNNVPKWPTRPLEILSGYSTTSGGSGTNPSLSGTRRPITGSTAPSASGGSSNSSGTHSQGTNPSDTSSH